MPQRLLLINPLNTPASQVSGAAACYIYYERAAASISLINDAGTAWLGPVALGSSSPLGNSQCTINAAQSNTNGTSVNDLYLNLAITLAPGYAGPKSTYEYVVDHASQIVGWNPVGTWTVPNAPVITTASLLPQGAVGTSYSQTLQATAGSPPYSYSLAAGSTLPPGLTLPPGGTLSGTPTTKGTWGYTVVVTDSDNNTGSQKLHPHHHVPTRLHHQQLAAAGRLHQLILLIHIHRDWRLRAVCL